MLRLTPIIRIKLLKSRHSSRFNQHPEQTLIIHCAGPEERTSGFNQHPAKTRTIRRTRPAERTSSRNQHLAGKRFRRKRAERNRCCWDILSDRHLAPEALRYLLRTRYSSRFNQHPTFN
ncbi:uncharacterized protein LOC119770147 [Culex quinquefasciatus]|uniref:uncharacterized protein LOC119770127 n=1 Tax=Culex quinquefasciatus TaxID=7176 RepID=UPI0018E3406E|nr:uncharacterized protein LOC119770127 [Culex quinquefasciatus]XP_038120446.1 uncharacterized protein LOC119770147 [Culex quinquefasciatus]XP_039442508.1 uncharacterized protein LOC120422974 [Culex pipiens pallens]